MRAVETTSAYFTRRARQERAIAADARSAQARKAHLELALRLVRVATEPALWAWPEELSGSGAAASTVAGAGLDDALVNAFPLPSSDSFEQLLATVDLANY